ncbi:MAG: GNAT family N-acetyltransferase, partial [Gemmataceae bacterium]|nr:GNAT family N-acetyltransferase [Gemmataceae bacterium]
CSGLCCPEQSRDGSGEETMTEVVITKPTASVLVDAVKCLADSHRDELGFHTRQSYMDSVQRGELIIATAGRRVVGFVRFHKRRDCVATIYEIATAPELRRKGVARRLLAAVVAECRRANMRMLKLSCPAELSANTFYETVGFVRTSPRSRPGKLRPLIEWQMPILPARPMTFVASLSNAANDLRHLIRLWEDEGRNERPFERCIITPLFSDSRSLQHVRYIGNRWGVEVVFDSGGFFVQQGKVTYDELFPRLLDFYARNDWAAAYVLPDYVPTSRNSPAEVEERVHVTAAEGVKFHRRMPRHLRDRALGVLQGHSATHLKFCLETYLGSGILHLGFGSFDTGGVNTEINLFTAQASQRLTVLRELLAGPYLRGETDTLPTFHLFGVSSPALLGEFLRFLATSFDSSGWLRTAGYGNVYLPFRSRRNVTHGASALSCGSGLTAAAFYAACAATDHACPFCRDFDRIRKDRYARMWHNALVFQEMTTRLNDGPAGRVTVAAAGG